MTYKLPQQVTWEILYVQESKSIGAEVNWGVRFRDQQDVCILVNNVFYCFISIHNSFDVS